MSKPKILILGNLAKPGVSEQIEALREWFEERVEILAVQDTRQEPPGGAFQAELALVFGGDGTLLSAARALAGTAVPMLGVNMGKLGFLAEYSIEQMQRHFEEILSGRVPTAERTMLQISLLSDTGESLFCSLAANDVAISAGEPFRMIDLLVQQAGSLISQYLGDGLVISTPTGSTGYNMSAGGPILEPTLDALTITPIAPHSLSMRPIVVRSDATISITPRRVNVGTAVIVDGQINVVLQDGQRVDLQRADVPMRIIPHPGRTFFQTLSNKLQWGRSPHHT